MHLIKAESEVQKILSCHEDAKVMLQGMCTSSILQLSDTGHPCILFIGCFAIHTYLISVPHVYIHWLVSVIFALHLHGVCSGDSCDGFV